MPVDADRRAIALKKARVPLAVIAVMILAALAFRLGAESSSLNEKQAEGTTTPELASGDRFGEEATFDFLRAGTPRSQMIRSLAYNFCTESFDAIRSSGELIACTGYGGGALRWDIYDDRADFDANAPSEPTCPGSYSAARGPYWIVYAASPVDRQDVTASGALPVSC